MGEKVLPLFQPKSINYSLLEVIHIPNGVKPQEDLWNDRTEQFRITPQWFPDNFNDTIDRKLIGSEGNLFLYIGTEK